MPKWLPDVSPDDRTADVAARALAGRLKFVRRYLKRVVKSAGAEDAHQLRVWARRADAALRLYADLLATKDFRWFGKWLGRLRKAAGRVRDSDVLAHRLSGPEDRWPVRLMADRRRGMKKVRRLAEQLDGGRRLRRRTRKLLNRIDDKLAGARTVCRPGAGMPPATCGRVLRGLSRAGTDDAALHRFRICGKELRYALELLAGAFPPTFREEIYPVVAALQDRLGLVNDLATAQRRLVEWLSATGDPAIVSHLHRRLAAVGEDLVRARADFYSWWSAALRDSLRRRFDEFLGVPLARR